MAAKSNPAETGSREYPTRQQQNLLLAEPIARLSHEHRVTFRDDPAIVDRLDVQYLALSAIDFVMERSAIESGALPAAILDHVAREAARMKPGLTEEQGHWVRQVILDHLANAREGHEVSPPSSGQWPVQSLHRSDLVATACNPVRTSTASETPRDGYGPQADAGSVA